MSKKTNVADRKAKMSEIMRQSQPPQMELTDVEKVTFGILLEKAQGLQAEFNRVKMAIDGLIVQIVNARGLDTAKYGVNLAAGMVLPIGIPDDGKQPDQVE